MKERGIAVALLVSALGALLTLGLITFFIFQAGVPLISQVGLWTFLTGTSWSPTSQPPRFGLLPMIVGSLWLTFGSLVIGVPLGLAVAIFMVELAPPSLAVIMRPAIQLLAGIPSVIYGFIGLTILAPLVRATLGGPGLSVLTGAIILGIMILPSVIAISEDAMRAVPRALRDGAVALGETHWQLMTGIILAGARSGIVGDAVLGVARGCGGRRGAD